MKFNFRKIASALASTAMVGSTVALAAAASFPAPFVNNGAADVAIVYGSNLDLGAVTDVSAALSTALASGTTSAGPATTDAYPLFTSSSPVLVNNSVNSIRTVVTESNLPNVLTEGSFSGNVDAKMTYRLNIGSNPRVIFAKEPTSSSDPGLGILLSTTKKNYLYNATVSFDKTVNLSHADSEGESINLFGQDFLISSSGDGTKLVLFKSAQTVFLSVGGGSENPSEVVTVDGVTYTVELTSATDTSATVKVTDDSTGKTDQKEISEAASKKIIGLEVAVNLASESAATSSISAEVIVGANRITLQNNNEVKVGSDDDPIQGTNVGLTGTFPALTGLTVQGFAADGSNDFVQKGSSYDDPVFSAFRVLFEDITSDTPEERGIVSVDPSGNDKMSITVTDRDGKTASGITFINNVSSAWGTAFLGDSNKWQIYTREMAKINESAMAVVGNEDEGYWVRLRTLSNSSSSTPGDDSIVFENVFDTSQSWKADTSTTEGTGTISIGGKEYTVTYWDDNNGNDDAYVQLQYPDTTGANDMVLFPTFEVSKGAKLAFYEPTTIALNNWSYLDANVTGFALPDGDGYTTIGVAPNLSIAGTAAGGDWNFSFTNAVGSVTAAGADGARTINVSATKGADSVVGTIGKLTYNITSSGTVDNAIIYLMEPSSNTARLTQPGLMMFNEKDDANAYEATVVVTGGNGDSNNGIGVTDVEFTFGKDGDQKTGAAYGTGLQRNSDSNLYDKMDQYGTMATIDQSTSDQYSLEISYPDTQASALLYVDAPSASGSTTTLGDVKLMDTELETSGMQTKNLIAIGGSCINTLAKSLTGASGSGCEASWTAATGTGANEWVVQTFANTWAPGKVATLVAGYEQGDTANAAKYLTTQTGVTTNVGDKWTGTTATTATLVSSGTTA